MTTPAPYDLTTNETVNVLLALSTYQSNHPADPENPRALWASQHIESAIQKLEAHHASQVERTPAE